MIHPRHGTTNARRRAAAGGRVIKGTGSGARRGLPAHEQLQSGDQMPRRVLGGLAHRPQQLLYVPPEQFDAMMQLRDFCGF